MLKRTDDKGYRCLTVASVAYYNNCLNDRWLVVRFPAETEIFLHRIQTGSGARLSSYSMPLSPEVKRPGREAEHSTPSSTITVKIDGTYTSTPTYVYMALLYRTPRTKTKYVCFPYQDKVSDCQTDWCHHLDIIFAGILYRCIKYTENYEKGLPLVILHFGVLEYFVNIKRWPCPETK